ncbi:hypothetical protein [Labrenzia sp. PHM005]|uniref:hypothetical protein n=1 Tax=Labrenzia sp. PHM005 TaxID=2590016 RepID=UPI00113FD31E|nr:hypothetical protein [Labrenzia sp. PHM005]QDG77335.1 hypothetical protein FJ695_16455 [Labrenzia sp. PHM005]
MSYEVSAFSLPRSLQDQSIEPARLEDKPAGLAKHSSPSEFSRKVTWFRRTFEELLETEPRSAERGRVIAQLQGHTVIDWSGTPIVLKRRTIYTWIKLYEAVGPVGLKRTKRSDRGKSRCFVSREWDRAALARIDDATKAEIADGLRQQVRGLIKGGATGKTVAVLASEYLKTVTVANGIRLETPAELDRICKVPRALIRSEQHLKKVYRHKKDRKASDDDRPRVKRVITGMQPMDCVVMDVHHVNVLLKRENGTTGTPKLLGFMDIATRRVWCELVFLETKGGVRNADVIEAFVAMAQHSAFGLPKTLYCDNGKEYLFADFLDDAMQLLVPIVGKPGKSRVIRALPYNASAKPIEAWFGHFEQQFLKTCPGYIGDDRMNPKRPALGRLAAPFNGDFIAFKRVLNGLLRAYEVMPQSGALKGLSPRQSFEAHVRQGWAATVIDPDRLNTVFTKPETRKVRQHGISVGGRRWSCDELDVWFHDTITVHIPQYHGYNTLRLTKQDGSFLGIAHPEEEFAFFDPRGARRSAERNTRRNKALREADRSTPDIDIGAELVKLAQHAPEVVPNVPRGTLTVTQELEHQRVLRPEHGDPCSESEDERDRREIAAGRDVFIRKIGRT